MCEVGCTITGPVCTGPGMVGVWVDPVSHWYVLEESGRRWWTNDPALIRSGSLFNVVVSDVEEEEQ